jgi:hypothetical protein
MFKFINVLYLIQWFMFSVVEGEGGDVNLDDIPAGDETVSGGEGDDKTSTDPLEQPTMADAIAMGLDQMNEGDDGAKKPDDKPKPTEGDDKPLAADDADKSKGGDKKPDADTPPAVTAEDLVEPEGLSAKASERFQKLVSGIKTLEEELEATRQEAQGAFEANNEFVTVMDTVGATPESLNTYIDYMAAVKEGKYEHAQAILEAQMEDLSIRMGKELPGVNMLKDYPDLQDDVDNFKITKERAVEIAKGRKIQAQQDAENQRQQQQTTQAEATVEAKKSGLADIDAFCKKKIAEDLDYKQKQAIIMESVNGQPSMLAEIVQKFPPQLWGKQLELIYRSIRVAKPSTGQRQPQPLRPSNGKGEAEPKTMQDAIFGPTGLNLSS